MLGWVLSGFSVGPQRVLSEYSGYSWVLRLFIFEYSGGSQAGTSTRTAPQPSVVHGVGGLAGMLCCGVGRVGAGLPVLWRLT